MKKTRGINQNKWGWFRRAKKKKNTKVPHALLCLLASLILAQSVAGLPLSSTLIILMMLALFQSKGHAWEPSKSWFGRFMHRIGLSFRGVTKCAHGVPGDFVTMFLERCVFIVMQYSIPPFLFFNLDETGVYLLPPIKKKWAGSGNPQVNLQGFGDERQFTTLLAISTTRTLARWCQLTWQGETEMCLPKGDEVKRMEDLVMHSFSLSHWSVMKTILEFVVDLWNRHILPLMKEKGLHPETQKWVLLWDCYAVHRCESLLSQLKGLYKNLTILIVPASCTSQLQLLDLSFNFAFKCILLPFLRIRCRARQRNNQWPVFNVMH